MIAMVLNNFWNLVIESAPWLLLGYFLAGVIKQIIPSSWVERQLAAPGLVSIVKGAVIGAPLPLCSCGVIPTALAVRKAGASKSATAAFLVATPETGVDSISFSYAVLGPVFAIARPIAALISAVVTGILVFLWDKEQDSPTPAASNAAQASCCSSEAEALNNSAAEESSCCSSEATVEQGEQSQGLGQKLVDAMRYGYGNMIEDTAKWLLIGLVGAALITSFVPQSFFTQWGDGVIAMLIMVVVGLPMYICATASTPVAASLLFAGISPGAALVFMLTGPATNIATMGVIKEQMGLRSLAAYLFGVIAVAIVAGLLLNSAYAYFGWSLAPMMLEHGEQFPLWRQLLAGLLALLVLRVGLSALRSRLANQGGDDSAEELSSATN